MIKKYFVIKDGREFLWKDGQFYPAFVKSAYAVDEEVGLNYQQNGCEIEYAEPDKWPGLYDWPEVKKPRRTYIRVSTFTLAAALDQLYDSENTYNIMLSMEDGDFLISFEYHRDYERQQHSVSDCICAKAEESK